MTYDLVESKAYKLIEQSGCSVVPVNVTAIARHLNLRIESSALEDGITGFLAIKDHSGVIGYSTSASRVQSGFIVAIAIGDYVLNASKQDPLFIYRSKSLDKLLAFRDSKLEAKSFLGCKAANAFAAALLMPKSLIEKELRLFGVNDITKAIQWLADRFDVSCEMMALRLANLDIVDYSDLL